MSYGTTRTKAPQSPAVSSEDHRVEVNLPQSPSYSEEEYRLLREAQDVHGGDAHLEANVSDDLGADEESRMLDEEATGKIFDDSRMREMRALTAATRKAVSTLTRGQQRTT